MSEPSIEKPASPLTRCAPHDLCNCIEFRQFWVLLLQRWVKARLVEECWKATGLNRATSCSKVKFDEVEGVSYSKSLEATVEGRMVGALEVWNIPDPHSASLAALQAFQNGTLLQACSDKPVYF